MCDARGQAAIQKARAIGASMLTSRQGTMPVSTAATSDIKRGADQQRSDDADGQIALRILGLLRGGRDRVESDIGEENVRRSGADAGEPIGRERLPVAAPVAGVHIAEAQADHEQHHRDLDDHDGRVEARALLDADRPESR